MSLKVLLFLSIYLTCALGALFNPILGVCGYIFTYSVYSEHVWWGAILAQYPIRYSFTMALFLFAGMLLQKNKINWTIRPYNKLEASFYLFIGIITLSLILGIPPDEHSHDLFNKMFKISIFLFMFIRVVNTLKYYQMLIFTLIATGIFLGLQAYQAPASMFIHGRLNMLGGPDFTGSNEFAIFLGAVSCFLGVAILKEKRWPLKFLYIIGAAFVLNGIILTRARAIFVAMLVATIYAIFFTPQKWRKQIFIYLILGGILFFQLVDPGFFARMKTLKNPEQEGSAASRLWIWKASLKMLMDYPLGVGIGNFGRMIGNYDGRIVGRDAHDTFVRCYGELGIHGLAFFMFIILLVFKQLGHIQKLARGTPLESRANLEVFALSLAIVVYLVAGLTHTQLYIEALWWLFAMPICLEKAVLNEIQRTK